MQINFRGLILKLSLQGTRFNATNLTDLLAANPAAVAPIVGYHIVKGAYSPASLTSGTVLNTTATLKEFNATDRILTCNPPF